uniref:Uncharacterized protein n=1 Tax=Chromera velia CCMP2878 TaxID=1169474 RepID=A0A0G4GE47_9ALVE|eukprot:Cvel_21490.t1-p1 / transcript=Cvel_21490.t1 / gene=Cvel_21490 / organism=Chromera_velia_CCMP2878 / gene_product=hypothetical protein / transcript_product=hypothetical protein / location=Cvel_scaffold2019:31174-32328(-) / protein_length=385 / sequence_SO=supercontig / SO=protein_coding / is_pseudo=false
METSPSSQNPATPPGLPTGGPRRRWEDGENPADSTHLVASGVFTESEAEAAEHPPPRIGPPRSTNHPPLHAPPDRPATNNHNHLAAYHPGVAEGEIERGTGEARLPAASTFQQQKSPYHGQQPQPPDRDTPPQPTHRHFLAPFAQPVRAPYPSSPAPVGCTAFEESGPPVASTAAAAETIMPLTHSGPQVLVPQHENKKENDGWWGAGRSGVVPPTAASAPDRSGTAAATRGRGEREQSRYWELPSPVAPSASPPRASSDSFHGWAFSASSVEAWAGGGGRGSERVPVEGSPGGFVEGRETGREKEKERPPWDPPMIEGEAGVSGMSGFAPRCHPPSLSPTTATATALDMGVGGFHFYSHSAPPGVDMSVSFSPPRRAPPALPDK